MQTSRLVTSFALVALALAEASAQRVPISIGHMPTNDRPDRARFLYERPKLSPWLGIELGAARPMVECVGCTTRYGMPTWLVTGGVGVTFLSRLTLAAERSGMREAELTMLSARIGTRSGFGAMAGFGRGRYSRPPTVRVDDRPAWTVGGEYCRLNRIDACGFLDYSQTGLSSDQGFGLNVYDYRMRLVRTGFAMRLHALRGRRITLPPRRPVESTGSPAMISPDHQPQDRP